MKLEVGMYVRTDDGIIEKINKVYDRHTTDDIVVWLNGYGDGKIVFIDDFEEAKYLCIKPRGFIKKEPSFNIIDLIEVGDYVNGFRVEYVYNPTGNKVLWIKLSCNPIDNYENKDIKSIITKEQFEQMSYKVGEKDNNKRRNL